MASRRGPPSSGGGSHAGPSTVGSGSSQPSGPLKVILESSRQEWNVTNTHLKIGRAPTSDIQIQDPMASGKHCQIADGMLSDVGSTNGTELNTKLIKKNTRLKLKAGDIIRVGDAVLRIEAGRAIQEDLSRSKRFGGSHNDPVPAPRPEDDAKAAAPVERKEDPEEAKMTVPELMEHEFARIIGHDNIKQQLRAFYKKVQLDQIRAAAGRGGKPSTTLYHMIFSGPPGTGKTTMANVVAKLFCKMKLTETDKVVFVNNALELIAQYSGQTPVKVDKKVAEAKGGVLFIDEAYSIVKGEQHQKDSFGKEAIETIMKHLDPPACVFIFAGYSEPMEEFLKVNEGLARRIPYRYAFEAYTPDQLLEILKVMCNGKGEELATDIIPQFPSLLGRVPEKQRTTQNAGMISNWVSFAQIERDDRIDIDEAIRNPAIACQLLLVDFEAALKKILTMTDK